MDWNCVLTEERLSDHLDGLLSPAEAAAFSAHVAGCEQCGKLVAQVGGLVGSMQRLEPLDAPPQLVTNILDATLGPRTQKQSWSRWFTWIPVLWQPRFTMGVATVVATLLIIVYTTGFSPAKLKRVDLNPANVFRAANRQAHLTYARSAKFVNDLRVVYEIQSRLQPDAQSQPIGGARSRAGTKSAAAFHESAGEIADGATSGTYAGSGWGDVCDVDGWKLDGEYRRSDSH